MYGTPLHEVLEILAAPGIYEGYCTVAQAHSEILASAELTAWAPID